MVPVPAGARGATELHSPPTPVQPGCKGTKFVQPDCTQPHCTIRRFVQPDCTTQKFVQPGRTRQPDCTTPVPLRRLWETAEGEIWQGAGLR